MNIYFIYYTIWKSFDSYGYFKTYRAFSKKHIYSEVDVYYVVNDLYCYECWVEKVQIADSLVIYCSMVWWLRHILPIYVARVQFPVTAGNK